jgi:hypothetical protein
MLNPINLETVDKIENLTQQSQQNSKDSTPNRNINKNLDK